MQQPITQNQPLANGPRESPSLPEKQPDEEAYLPHYVPSHVNDHCACPHLSVGEESLSDRARSGKMTLVAFEEGKSPPCLKSVEVDPHDISLSMYRFVAISHVRGEGLGNTRSSSLPTCQVRRLQTIVNDLDSGPDHCVLFWIDTLCLPQSLPLRKGVSGNIHYMFRKAEVVLVISPSFTSRTVGLPEACLAAIQCSSWIKRLWTLQEGALASRLIFQFGNGTVNLDELLQTAALPKQHFSAEASLSEQIHQLSCDIKRVDLRVLGAAIHFKGSTRQLKQFLFSILRLCYLGLLPRFESFTELSEKNLVVRVRPVIERFNKATNQPIKDPTLNNPQQETLGRLIVVLRAFDVGNKLASDIM